jgi:hypothetical protein
VAVHRRTRDHPKHSKKQLFDVGMHLANDNRMSNQPTSAPNRLWLIVLGIIVAVLVAVSFFFPVLTEPEIVRINSKGFFDSHLPEMLEPAINRAAHVIRYWVSR